MSDINIKKKSSTPPINIQSNLIQKTNSRKGDQLKTLKKFCRILEKNMNNYIDIHNNSDPNRIIKGLYLKIDSVNGIKKILPKEKIIKGNKYFLRFFITFFNSAISQFFGNTYKSPLLNIKFNQTGHYELNELEPLYIYFLSDIIDQKNAINAILEIIFVETSDDLRIISQSCEGWGIMEVLDTPVGKMGNPTQIYMGTPRNLMYKPVKSK